MSQSLRMETDPTRTYITWNEFGNMVSAKTAELQINPPTTEEMLLLRLRLMQEELLGMFDDFLWLMMTRADMFAVEWMNRITPEYHFTTQWTPSDDALFNELLNGVRGYLTEWTGDIQTEAAAAIREHAGESAQQIGQAVAEVIQSERNRGVLIARTELMRAFNGMADKRYKAAGFRAVWLTALDPSVCDICEPLHGRPIDEIGHVPPAHPLCRCTEIPVLVTEK